MTDNLDSSHPVHTSAAAGTPTARWQPSTRDVTSPTYAGAGGYRVKGQQPSTKRRFHLGWASVVVLSIVGVFALIQVASITTDRALPDSLQPIAFLDIVQGSVGLLTSDGVGEPIRSAPASFAPLSAGAPLQVGAVLDTGLVGRAGLRLASGPSVRLDHDSRVQMASNAAMVLERGAVYVDSATGSGVEVRTVFGVVRDIGTQFEVRLIEAEDREDGEPALRVRVREGEIELQPDKGPKHGGVVGEEVILTADGRVQRRAVAIYGDAWDWVLETAASIEIEGWSLHQFVDWLSREGGWDVEYGDETINKQAREIVLHGSSEGLNPLQVAEMVFDSTGLQFHIEKGVIHIEQRLQDDGK